MILINQLRKLSCKTRFFLVVSFPYFCLFKCFSMAIFNKLKLFIENQVLKCCLCKSHNHCLIFHVKFLIYKLIINIL